MDASNTEENILHLAVKARNKHDVEYLIKQGVDVNMKDRESDGMTPLHYAVKENDMEIATMLLAAGANINEVNKYKTTPLHIALNDENEEMMTFLLQNGANVNVKKFGKSPLHLVVENKAVHLTQLLLKYGSNVDEISADGQTALQIAIDRKDTDMVKLLLDNDARTDVKKFGRYPLYHAVKNNSIEIVKLLLTADRNNADDVKEKSIALGSAFTQKNRDIVHTLLELGVDPNAMIQQSYPLHLACENEWLDIVTLLLSKGANASALSLGDNLSALHVALKKNSKDIVKLLLKRVDIDVNQTQQPSGLTPLHLAVQNNDRESTCLLLIRGAEPNASCNLGVTPLHTAFDKCNREIIDVLLDYDADLRVPKSGPSALEIAVDQQWLDMVKKLLLLGADPNESLQKAPVHCLVRAIKYKNIELARILLDYDADVNTPDSWTLWNPLKYAVYYHCPVIAQMLIDRGAILDYENGDGQTALHCALERGDELMTELLLDAGADHSINLHGNTTLHYAAKNGWHRVAQRLLLSENVEIDARTHYYYTPLFIAVRTKDVAMCKLLLDHKASVNHSIQGRTILTFAVASRNREIVGLLLDRGARINDVNDQPEQEGYNALFTALNRSDDEMAMLLISRKASLRMREPTRNRMPLHEAVLNNCVQTVKMMIARGANVNTRDRYGDTPLHIAANRKFRHLMELLLTHRANVNARNQHEQRFTPLHCSLHAHDYEGTKLLLREGALIHTRPNPTAFVYVLRDVREERFLRLLLNHDYYSHERMDLELDVLPNIANLPTERPPVAQMILRHIVRKGIELSPAMSRALTVQQHRYIIECEIEIQQMREDKFYNNVNFHWILCKNIDRMVVLASNPELVSQFEASDYRNKYPIYAKVLDNNMEWAREMSELINGAEGMLIVMFDFVFEQLISRKILKYLSGTDLRNLCQVYNEMKAHRSNDE